MRRLPVPLNRPDDSGDTSGDAQCRDILRTNELDDHRL
jgi:hypothetical protein